MEKDRKNNKQPTFFIALINVAYMKLYILLSTAMY